MKALPIFLALACLTSAAQAATDAYIQWATSKWGSTTVGSSGAKATTWGESADPDKDGLFNLLEYACDTDPTRHNPASDLYQFTVPPSGLPSSRYPQLFAWLRTDDPDLRITCQTSDNLVYWYPDAPVNFDQPPPANPHVWTQETGNLLRGLRQMHFIDVQSLAVRPAAFMRLSVSRRGSTVTSPGVDPFSFTSQPGVATGSTARSSAIVLGGFAGNVTLNIPAGVTLFVNGIAKTGSTATVKAGDTLWMQATAPGIAGVPRNYTLTIGGQSATWAFTTAAIAAVPDHPGTDSGYTPVETGVSDTGAAQISIPIVVSPGTAGMQPKLSIGYSSQGGNGPLGVGFSLSGLSTISRVGRTVAQDGVKGGVTFDLDGNDRFVLDGQRLIAINGADGADGTEYRLEFDPTSRIRSYGREDTGPQRWMVETKAGLRLEFGRNTNSRIKREGGFDDPVLIWAVEQIVDTSGNVIHFAYDEAARQHGEMLIKRIIYGIKESDLPAQTSVAPQPLTMTSFRGQSGKTFFFSVTARTPDLFTAVWGTDIYTDDSDLSTAVVHAGRLSPGQTGVVAVNILDGLSYYAGTTRNGVTSFQWSNTSPWPGSYSFGSSAPIPDPANIVAPSEVVFEYEIRPDTRISYMGGGGGGVTRIEKRMTSIESRSSDGTLLKRVRRYELAYNQSTTTKRSRLASVSELSGLSISPMTTVLDWGTDTPAVAIKPVVTTAINGSLHTLSHTEVLGDFDGDGRTDILSYNQPPQPATKHYKLYLARDNLVPDGSGSIFHTGIATNVEPSADTSREPVISGDFNGDGKIDILLWDRPFANQRYNLLLANGNGFDPATATSIQADSDSARPVHAADFNGDGRTDLLVWNKPFNNSRYNLYLADAGGFGAPIATDVDSANDANRENQLLGDFNGDGMFDILIWNRPNNLRYNLYLGTGSGFGSPQTTDMRSFGNSVLRDMAADVNGDGITDVLIWHNPSQNNRYNLYLGKGGEFFASPIPTVLAPSDSNQFRPRLTFDFNMDGILDMMSWDAPFSTSRYNANAYLGNGTAFDSATATTVPSWDNSQVVNQVGDFDGDGRSDVMIWHSPFTNYRFNIYFSEQAQIDLLRSAENSHGGQSFFAYKPITDSSVHTKGTGSIYPCYDLQAPMYVVSSTTTRNGIDGNGFTPPPVSPVGENTVSYRYEGAWSCLDGRGFMGFKAVVTTDATSGIITRTEYESSSPLLAGRVKHTEQRLLTAPVGGSALISESDTTWNITTTINVGHPNTYFVTEASSTSKAYEVNKPAVSALVKTATRNGFSYDGYGNLLTSTTTTSGAETFTETVTNTYADAPTLTQWFLGRLETSSVTKTAPNPAGGGNISLTRASSFAYHPTTGLLTQEVIEPSGGILRQQKDYTHDGFGNILTSTISTSGAASRTTTTTYTPDGRFVETTTNALNHTESKTYDPLLGNVLTQTGPNNLTTTWNYDAIGRPIQETRPDGTVTRSFYRRVTGSTVGAPPRAVHYVRVQSSGGAPKTVWYDLLDREIRADGIAFDGRTVSSHKVFNNRGEVTHASQPYFAGDTPLYSQMLYDAVGREYQQTDPGNRVSKTTYDGLTTTVERNYNPAALTDFQKAVTVVNAMGWTVQSSQYLGNAAKTITRKYDPYGNLRFVTDPANNTTELSYDVRGNKTYMSEPNSGTSTFTYNGFGELKTQTNNANQTVSLSYDKLGRVLTRTEPEGVTTFEYDSAAQGIGQLARESSGDFVRSYCYDHLSRPVSTVESHGFHSFAVSRSYDAYGRPDAMTYPTGLATRQVYTANGHLSEVQNAATTQLYWRALAVNARGQITQEVQGNGVVTERAFDADSGLIDGITSTFGAAGDVQKAEFDFDLIGNLTARRDKRYSTAFSETFGYDTLNRLQTVTTTGAAAVTAAYNDLGNITSRTDVGSFSYGAASTGPHALTGVTGGAFNKSCGYDAKGNRTTDGATSLTYSSFNKPVRMVKGGDTLRFDYGPDRALYRQTTFLTQPGGATSQTVREYIGGLYERETTSEGLVRHIHYIAGGSGVAAILTDERSASTTAQRTRYIHKDHLGSVDVITDSAGAVVERQSFDAWGRRRTVAYNSGTSTWSVTYPATPGSAETHRGFTGHEMLDAVGLVHMGGRIYDPITARFLSPDPFVQSPDNLQNLNRYSYVLNNPLSFTDPSGFFFKGLGKFLKKTIGLGFLSNVLNDKTWNMVAAIGIGIATGNVFAAYGAVAAGAGFGFGSAFSGTLLAGGSVGDALRAGLKGGVISGISAGAADWVGGAYGKYPTLKSFVHGAVQGGIRQASGGSFMHGFMSATFADIAGAYIGDGGSIAGRTAIASVVGGTAEVIGGGKFGNGAITGAFVHLFNKEAHHDYKTKTAICDLDGGACRLSAQRDYFVEDASAPLRLSLLDHDGKLQLLGGSIYQDILVDNQSQVSVRNSTAPGHFFEGGHVDRTMYEAGGKLWVETHGVGSNIGPVRAWLNQTTGPILFKNLDFDFVQHVGNQQMWNRITGIHR